VTLAGKTAVGRGGASVLSNAGLTHFIAHTPEEYISIAVGLAGDRAGRQLRRSTLREQLKSSPLMDGKRFAADIEAAYRELWRQWCGKPV
jgi:predicted O-linked N-acetylglucosamine transferase (SPINDLY family)